MCTRTQTLVHSGMQQAAWHLLFEVGSHLLVHRKGQSRGQKRFPADHAAFILSSIVRFWSGGGEKRLMICREGRRFPWCAVDHASLPPPCAPCCVPCRLIYWKQDVVGLAVCRRLVPCFAALLLLSCQAVELFLKICCYDQGFSRIRKVGRNLCTIYATTSAHVESNPPGFAQAQTMLSKN
jgi:hypothetical protein